MSSCLGIYIEKNLIKYAKVTKEKEKTKIETFGVKEYENLEQVLQQVIEETFSFKIPISVNIAGEQYMYADMFALLQDKDLRVAADTEFKAIIDERGSNSEAYEMRKVFVPKVRETDKLKVVYVAINKAEIEERTKWLGKSKVQGVFTTALTLPTLLGKDSPNNSLIVNMEEETTITKIIDKHVYDVEVLENNSREVLKKIAQKENSFIKAYEACKNTTIYTSEGVSSQGYDLGYLEEIMPTIFQILEKVKKTLNDSEAEMKRVYLTGTLALINNIDLYFQENITDVKCEVLKPSFVPNGTTANTKDHIEMNTPVSLALAGLGEGIKGINFKKESPLQNFKFDFNKKEKAPKEEGAKGSKINFNIAEKLDGAEIHLLRTAVLLLVVFATYSLTSIEIFENTQEKIEDLEQRTIDTNTMIGYVNSDTERLKVIEAEYQGRIENIEIIENRIADIDRTRNRIPNLLQHVMHVIPEGVQLISIENTGADNVEIKFQSDKYEQIGYFTASIKEEQILMNVQSSSSQKTR